VQDPHSRICFNIGCVNTILENLQAAEQVSWGAPVIIAFPPLETSSPRAGKEQKPSRTTSEAPTNCPWPGRQF
jgi:hypothetical protein